MIKIIHGPMKIERKKNDIKSCTALTDSVHIKFGDNTELILMMSMTPEKRAVIGTLERIAVQDFIVNFNDPKKLLEITG